MTQSKKFSFYLTFYLKNFYRENRARLQLLKELNREEAILVHTMGKVGSSTVYHSLKDLHLDTPIYHTHFLHPERIKVQRKNLKEKQIIPDSQLFIGKHLQKYLESDAQVNWKVITLIREPIARNISAFFENITKRFKHFLIDYQSQKLNIDTLIDTFLTEYPHDLPLMWLDWEINSIFGVDVFSAEFPKDIGFTIIEKSNVKLLVIRLDKLEDCTQKAFKEFLSLESFVLSNNNVAESKNYYSIYKDFQNSINLPKEYIEEMYNSKYTQHFFTPHEISAFNKKWLR